MYLHKKLGKLSLPRYKMFNVESKMLVSMDIRKIKEPVEKPSEQEYENQQQTLPTNDYEFTFIPEPHWWRAILRSRVRLSNWKDARSLSLLRHSSSTNFWHIGTILGLVREQNPDYVNINLYVIGVKSCKEVYDVYK